MSETTEKEVQTEEKPAEKQDISAEDLAKLLKSAEERAAELERRYKEVQARVASVERERDDATGRVRTEATSRFQAEEVAIANAIAAANAAVDRLESEVAALNADGKYAEAAKALRAMAAEQAKVQQYEARKEWLAGQKQQFEAQAQKKPETADPLSGYSPAAREWIEKHPDFLTDARYRNRVTAAHYSALAEGHQEGTKAYFDAIEAIIEPKQQANDDDPPQQPRARQATVPVNRTTPQAAARQTTIRLSPDEREVADAMLSHIKEPDARYKRYAEMREQLKAQGRI